MVLESSKERWWTMVESAGGIREFLKLVQNTMNTMNNLRILFTTCQGSIMIDEIQTR